MEQEQAIPKCIVSNSNEAIALFTISIPVFPLGRNQEIYRLFST